MAHAPADPDLRRHAPRAKRADSQRRARRLHATPATCHTLFFACLSRSSTIRSSTLRSVHTYVHWSVPLADGSHGSALSERISTGCAPGYPDLADAEDASSGRRARVGSVYVTPVPIMP